MIANAGTTMFGSVDNPDDYAAVFNKYGPQFKIHIDAGIATYARWDGLSAYLHDGSLQIDNNLVENAIRPVALRRKNWLFAGSHKAAQRAAMAYSFFAICKKHEVNPFQWLKHTLLNIAS